MLLRFACENHRSILDSTELSMIAVDRDRPSVRTFDLLNEGVVSVAGIYGANASGKSNVLDALLWLSSAVDNSLRLWDQYIPRDPFKFGIGPESPSVYEIEMMVDDVRYRYTLELDSHHIHSETLISYPRRHPRILLQRDGMDLELRRGLPGETATRELLTPTSLALSAAMRFDVSEVEPFARALSSIWHLGVRPSRSLSAARLWLANVFRQNLNANLTEQVFLAGVGNDESNAELRSRQEVALALLRHADLGIDDVEVAEPPTGHELGRRHVRLLHKVGSQTVPFDMYDESEGTQTWFRLIGPVLEAIGTGNLLVVDEIDASLHPRLSAVLLGLFQDPASNPRGAQIVFSSHDTSLLNHLNRDEVWLTEKDSSGSTRLTALAEFGGDKVRRSLNLERAYLQGRFGGLPEADQLLMREALGVITGSERRGE